jgi:hypothetical protein
MLNGYNMKLKILTEALGVAKAKEKKLKKIIANLQLDIYKQLQINESETFKNSDVGQVTVSYKNTYLYQTDDAKRKILEIDRKMIEAEEKARHLKERKKLVIEDLIHLGEVKVNKDFSHIRYTKPKE